MRPTDVTETDRVQRQRAASLLHRLAALRVGLQRACGKGRGRRGEGGQDKTDGPEWDAVRLQQLSNVRKLRLFHSRDHSSRDRSGRPVTAYRRVQIRERGASPTCEAYPALRHSVLDEVASLSLLTAASGSCPGCGDDADAIFSREAVSPPTASCTPCSGGTREAHGSGLPDGGSA